VASAWSRVCLAGPGRFLSFPTRRSSDLEARRAVLVEERVARQLALPVTNAIAGLLELRGVAERVDGVHRLHEREGVVERHLHLEDRKSTRLNSSHVKISYAVFASKKKTT